LVGYWNADGDLADTKLTTAYDWSGEGNDGDMKGDAVSTAGGVYGKGFTFDGDGDSVDCGDVDEMDGLNQTAVSMWFRSASTTDDGTLISKYEGFAYSTMLFKIWTESNGGETYIRIVNSSYSHPTTDVHRNFLDKKWHHMVLNYNGTDATLYFDTILRIGPLSLKGPLNSVTAPLLIGGYLYDGDAKDSWNGTIDDVMIFNTSLTPAQILEIYNNQSARFLETGTQKVRAVNIEQDGTYDRVNVSTTVQENMDSRIEARVGQINMSVDTTGLVAYYPFEWGSAVDISGEGNDGALVDDVSWNSTGGRNLTGGFSFDGAGDYVDFGATDFGANQTEISVSAWVYNNPGSYNKRVFSQAATAGGNGIDMYWHGSLDIIFFTIRNASFGSAPAYEWCPSGEWVHVVGTYNETAAYIYINGVLGTTWGPAASVGPVHDSVYKSAIGADGVDGGSGDGARHWNGSIDDVMIFNRSLSATEITNLYNNQSLNHDGNPYYTDYQNITSDTNETFTINTEADFVFPDYKFLAGNDTTSFYTPLILGDTSIESFEFTAAGDSCTYDVGNWEIDCADDCTISSNVDLMGNNFSTSGTGTITLTANITNYTLRTFRGTDSSNKCVISGIGGWFKSSG